MAPMPYDTPPHLAVKLELTVSFSDDREVYWSVLIGLHPGILRKSCPPFHSACLRAALPARLCVNRGRE